MNLHDIFLDWTVLDSSNFHVSSNVRLISHEVFTVERFEGDGSVELVEKGWLSSSLKWCEFASLFFWAFRILWVADKKTVILANGSNMMGNLICLLNYYIFFRTRIILFWDSHLEPKSLIKRYFAKRCFLGCRIATMWSAQQVQNYARVFNLPVKQFIYIPYKANHSKMVKGGVSPLTLDYVFAGGNGKRDYNTLVKAVQGTEITVIISATRQAVRDTIKDLPNVIPLAAVEPSYAKLMAASRFVVIPMISTGLKGGGEANFCNAMWHNKPVIAMDDISAADYIVEGETGYIVSPGNTIMLRQRILELWQDKKKCQEMGAKGRKRVERYFTHTLCINRLIRLAYIVGEDALNTHHDHA